MGKVVSIFLISILLYAQDFQTRCQKCHNQKRAPLKKIFFDYLLYYSSKEAVLKAMKKHMLHPDKRENLSKNLYKHSIKQNELDRLLQKYWDKYKVFGKIK